MADRKRTVDDRSRHLDNHIRRSADSNRPDTGGKNLKREQRDEVRFEVDVRSFKKLKVEPQRRM
jgi:hypothetical protein